MTKWQAQEWVHNKLIIVDMCHDELVAAFTALADRPPGTADRRKGLFRGCCEIVTSSASPLLDQWRDGVLDGGRRACASSSRHA